jgi:multidrug efflux pump subunit AcrB
VRTAESWAFPPRELRVELDLRRMAELGLVAGQVIQAVQSENADIPAGVIDIGPRSFSLKTSGAYTNLDQVRDTVVASPTAQRAHARRRRRALGRAASWSHVGRYNGKRAVFVTANMKDGFNIQVQAAHRRCRVERYSRRCRSASLEEGFDQSKNVEARSTASTSTSASRSRS